MQAPTLPNNVTVNSGCSLSADPARGITPSVARSVGVTQWRHNEGKLTGLTQNSQVDLVVLTENPYKSLNLDPDTRSTL
jgi:hypothetical protein